MSASPGAEQARTSVLDAAAVYFKRRVLIVLFFGFSSGLPLALSGTTLAVWLKESDIDLGIIGLFGLAGTPYTIKFLWAPLTDALDVPVLTRLLGRRRGWLVFTQILLIAAIAFLGSTDPARAPALVAFGALLVATASATQDIVVDAFRVESLPENEQAAGMASYVAAYRIGMLVSTAGALFLVSGFQGLGLGHSAAWSAGYAAMAVLVLIGVATTLVAHESEKSASAVAAQARETSLQRVVEAAVGAFSEFLTRDLALVALVFVILFKFTDALSGAMTAPFVIDLGFSRNEYAAIIKGVGLAATLIGGFAGGSVARAYSLPVSLWIGGLAQGFANLAFSWQAVLGHNAAWLTLNVMAHNLSRWTARIGDLNTPHGDNSQFYSPTTGFPAINVPMGFTRGGTLPAGMTIYGRAWSEALMRWDSQPFPWPAGWHPVCRRDCRSSLRRSAKQ